MIKPSTEDRTQGTIHEVKGKIKEQIGKAIKNPELENSGNTEKIAGKVQKVVGNVEKAIGS